MLSRVFGQKAINVSLQSTDKDEVLEELVEQLLQANPGLDRSKVLASVIERESKMSTGIGRGVAVPHGKTSAVKGIVGAAGISKSGIDFDSLDGKPVHLFFMIISSPDECEAHLQAMKQLSQMLCNAEFSNDLINAETAEDAFNIICRFDDAQ